MCSTGMLKLLDNSQKRMLSFRCFTFFKTNRFKAEFAGLKFAKVKL